MADFVKSSCILTIPHPGGGSSQIDGYLVCWYGLQFTIATKDGPKVLGMKSYHRKSTETSYMILTTAPDTDASVATEDTTASTRTLADDEYRVCVTHAGFEGVNESLYNAEQLFFPKNKIEQYGGLRWYLKGANNTTRAVQVIFDAAKVPEITDIELNVSQTSNGSFIYKGNKVTTSDGHMALKVPQKLSMLVKREDGSVWTLGSSDTLPDNVVTTDGDNLITGNKTFTKPPKITAPATEPEHAVNRAYIDSIINAKEPFDCAVTLHAAAASVNGWVVMSNLEISLANGKKLKCLHLDNTQPLSATAPVKCVFGLVEESAAIDAAPEKHDSAFFTSYQLKENEFWGSVTYGALLDKQWKEYSSYTAPFYNAQYGVQGTSTDLKPMLRIGIEQAPAAVKKMKLTWDGSYLPSKAQASLDGCGLPVSSKLYESVTAGSMEIPFDLVKLTGLVTLDSEQTITGAKSFTVLPKSEAVPKNPEDLTTKAYLDSYFIFDQTITIHMMEEHNTYCSYHDLKFVLDNGKHLVPLYLSSDAPQYASAPVPCIFKESDTPYVSKSVQRQANDWFDSYELKPGEYRGQVFYTASLGVGKTVQHTGAYGQDLAFDNYLCKGKEPFSLEACIKFKVFKIDTPIVQIDLLAGDSYNNGEYEPEQFKITTTFAKESLESKTYTRDEDHIDMNSAHSVKFSFQGDGFVTVRTNQTVTGLKTFKVLPQSEATPADAKDLVTKKYVDEKVAAGGGGSAQAPTNMVTTDTEQSITAVKTFAKLPKSDAVPADNAELVNKKYVDDKQGKVVTLDTDQTITATKTFGKLPKSTAEPADEAELVTKKYVDAKVAAGGGSGGGANLVTLDTAQTITGVKTFSTLPQSEALPQRKQDFTTKKYITQSCVMLEGNQTVKGLKTFISLPQSTATPTLNDELTTKKYVDGLITSGTSELQIYGEQGSRSGSLGFTDLQIVLLDGRYLNPKYVVIESDYEASVVSETPIIYEISTKPYNNGVQILTPDKFEKLYNYPMQLVGYMYSAVPSLHEPLKDHRYSAWGLKYKSSILSYVNQIQHSWDTKRKPEGPQSNIPYGVMGYIFPETPVPIHYVSLKNTYNCGGFMFKSRVGNTLYTSELIMTTDTTYSDLWTEVGTTKVIKAFINPNLRHLPLNSTLKTLEDRIKKLEEAAAPKP